MIEWQSFKCHLRRVIVGELGVGRCDFDAARIRFRFEVRHKHCPFYRSKPAKDLPHPLKAIMGLAVVTVGVHAEQNARFDLAKSINHARGAEIR